MKRTFSLLLTFALVFTALFSGAVFGAADDPVQFIVDEAGYVDGQAKLEVRGHYVNVGTRTVVDVSEVQLDIYDNGQLVISSTYVKDITEAIYMKVGAASRQYTFKLPDPVKGLKLSTITATSKVVYNPGTVENLPAGKKVYYQGIPVVYDVAPSVINGRLMVPARATFEKMGAQVEWNAEAKSISVFREADKVILFIGSPTMTVNGTPVKLDAPAQIIDGRTLVPLRAISSALGDKILYGAQSEVVAIYSVK